MKIYDYSGRANISGDRMIMYNKLRKLENA